jgi:hypothetical protein
MICYRKALFVVMLSCMAARPDVGKCDPQWAERSDALASGTVRRVDPPIEEQIAADKRWVSVDGDLSAATSWSPIGVPGLNDSLFFDGDSDMDVVSHLAAFSGVDKNLIWMTGNYYGSVGADGNPLTVPVAHLIYSGLGSLYHAFQTHSTQTTYVVIDSTNLQDAYTFASGGSATSLNLFLINGHVNILSGAGPFAGISVGSRSFTNQPEVTIGNSVGNVTNYFQRSGVVTTNSALGTSSGSCIVDGGSLIYTAAGTSDWNRLVITGGNVKYNGTGTLAECVVSNGTLDMTHDSRAKTITTLTLLPGAVFSTHFNITVTNLIDLRTANPILPYEFQGTCEGDDFDGDGTPDVCDRDIDDDGIPNVIDVCDYTPAGIAVDDTGRPLADANRDCTVDLHDFGIFQNSMIGP